MEEIILKAKEAYITLAVNHTDETANSTWMKIKGELNPDDNEMIAIVIRSISDTTSSRNNSDKAVKKRLIEATKTVFIHFEMIEILHEKLNESA